MFQIEVSPMKLFRSLIVLSAIFIVLGAGRIVWHYFMGPELLDGVLSRLDPNQEASLPTWFAIMLLLGSAILLAAIAAEKRHRSDPFFIHWVGLALVFLLMSIDECANVHELFNGPLREWFDLSGPLYWSWVLPGAAFVSLFAICYLRFIAHLSHESRNLFLLSGGIYVFGSLGVEMVGAAVYSAAGLERTPAYLLVTVFEEGCELIGISVFVFALLRYLSGLVNQIRIGLASSNPVSMPAPQ